MATAKKSADREKALAGAIAQIERAYGKGAVMKLDGDNTIDMSIDTVSTGSLGLDLALGIGGLPRGRICEIYGPESSGKTTLTLQVIAEAQKLGLNCAFVDAEHALDTLYAEKLGVSLEDLYISQPDHGEQALGIVDTFVRSGAMDVIIVDSVAALTPQKELEGDIGDSSVGVQARMMSQAMRKLAGIVKQCPGDFYQPNSYENRRYVWLARDHNRRERSQVLLIGSPRYSPHRITQRQRRCRWEHHKGQGGQEQGRGPIQAR
jgi:recombination protein RecA